MAMHRSSTLSLFLDFDFMATRTACQPQNAFSNCISRSASRGSVWLSYRPLCTVGTKH